MAQAIPTATRLRLTRALDQWPLWQATALQGKPELVRPLGQGLSNHSFLVAAGTAQFVLRLSGASTGHHGLQRRAEWQALAHACAAGLTPAPRFLDAQLGILVCDYLPPDPDSQASPAAVGALLCRIHGLPAIAATLAVEKRCTRAAKALHNTQPQAWQKLRPLAARIAPLLARLDAATSPQALCHNDLLRANRIASGGRLWAIDWEYAAMGPVWFDLAATCAGDELNAAECHALLTSYLQRAPQQSDWHQLSLFECGYRYLELLWHAYTSTAPAAASLAAKQARLEHCLAAFSRT